MPRERCDALVESQRTFTTLTITISGRSSIKRVVDAPSEGDPDHSEHIHTVAPTTFVLSRVPYPKGVAGEGSAADGVFQLAQTCCCKCQWKVFYVGTSFDYSIEHTHEHPIDVIPEEPGGLDYEYVIDTDSNPQSIGRIAFQPYGSGWIGSDAGGHFPCKHDSETTAAYPDPAWGHAQLWLFPDIHNAPANNYDEDHTVSGTFTETTSVVGGASQTKTWGVDEEVPALPIMLAVARGCGAVQSFTRTFTSRVTDHDDFLGITTTYEYDAETTVVLS